MSLGCLRRLIRWCQLASWIVLGSPVQSFVKIWQDWDLDWSSQVEEPWKTGLTWCQLVQCGFGQFSTVERPVSTSFSLNLLRTSLVATDNICNWVSILLSLVLQQGYPSFSFREGGVRGGGERVHRHPLSLPHHIVIICPSPSLSSSAPPSSSCGCFHKLLLLSCRVIIAKGGRGWGGDVAVVGRGWCCLAHITATLCHCHPPVSIVFTWPLSHVVVNTKGGRGWGGDMAVVGSGWCCCVRYSVWKSDLVQSFGAQCLRP